MGARGSCPYQKQKTEVELFCVLTRSLLMRVLWEFNMHIVPLMSEQNESNIFIIHLFS